MHLPNDRLKDFESYNLTNLRYKDISYKPLWARKTVKLHERMHFVIQKELMIIRRSNLFPSRGSEQFEFFFYFTISKYEEKLCVKYPTRIQRTT